MNRLTVKQFTLEKPQEIYVIRGWPNRMPFLAIQRDIENLQEFCNSKEI